MLTKAGVKLLDIGLAKEQAGAVNVLATGAPTVAAPLTAQGTILGTVQYMAPEQLEGAEADARSDIFAFGAMLYEMVTGRRAFQGQTHASLIGAILKDDPPRLSQVLSVPSALDHLVRACLAKNPEDRFQTRNDVLLQLRWVRDAGSDAVARGLMSARVLRRLSVDGAAGAYHVLAERWYITWWSGRLQHRCREVLAGTRTSTNYSMTCPFFNGRLAVILRSH